jgi:hypothetical protein
VPPGAPAVSDLTLSPRRFRAGHKSTVSFTLTEAASVRFRIERAASGRKAGGTCVRRTQANRSAAHCTRYVKLTGKIDRAGTQGKNSFTFRGRLDGKRLKPRGYRLRAIATGLHGVSAAKHARFKIRS